MAEGDENQQHRRFAASTSEDSSSDVEALDLDLVSTGSDRVPKRAPADIGMPEQAVRKEDNPFSFRHFLNTAERSYHNQGARPKVYCEGRPISIRPHDVEISDVSSVDQHIPSRLAGEYPSALPDFVQDHLVIEQCYLKLGGAGGSGNGGAGFTERSDNLPDCTLERERRLEERPYRMQEFPLDLPLTGDTQPRSTPRSSPQVIPEVGNSQSLPDFLADTAPAAGSSGSGGGGGGGGAGGVDEAAISTEWEADRLRLELENARRQLADKSRLAECLTHELEMARSKNHEYTQNLAKAWEQVEENLERSKIRANSSENNIMKLRQEVNLLNKEVNRLKRENMALRSEEGAIGGPGVASASACGFDNNAPKHVAQDLRAAASSAEHSLRQLLSGVENLRLLASRVETLSNYDNLPASYISDEDVDDDDANAGPAL